MTTYDQVNGPSTFKRKSGGQATNYVASGVCSPFGAVHQMSYGSNQWRHWQVNTGLQPAGYWETIGEDPSKYLRQECPVWVDANQYNNGTQQGATILAGGPDSLVNLPQYRQTFGYDNLNRLTSASETSASGSWSQTYQYDTWGNMWMPNNSLGAPAMGPGAPPANVYSASEPGKNRNVNSTYDAAGNLTMFGSMSISYDAENRQIAAGGTSYAYDGAGQRVKKVAPSGTTVYVYDAFGQLAAEYASGPAAGSACANTCYLSYDFLGSVRLVTDGQHNVVARHDYAPFGQEIPAGVGGRTSFWAASDSVNQKFTGYERDGESSLDFAQARYMSSGLGRFMSPDPGNAGADFTNPQSWNAYAYVLGNPLGNVDPSGMSDNPCSSNFSCLAQIPGCLDDVTACQQKVFWPDTALGWYPFRLIGIPSGYYWNDGWHPVYGGDALLYAAGLSLSTGSTATRAPAVTPAKNEPQKPNGVNVHKVGSCLVDATLNHYGLTAATGASGLLALPIPKAIVPPYKVIGTPTTNLLSVMGRYVEINVPRIMIAGRTSGNLLRILGRANPYIAGGLLAIDVGMISYDAYGCYQQSTQPKAAGTGGHG